jgi:fructose/tagatose bisphosphate aldolase
MALVSMRELLDHAAANGYGIPAFNVNNLEQVQAVMEAAKEVGAPVILQSQYRLAHQIKSNKSSSSTSIFFMT